MSATKLSKVWLITGANTGLGLELALKALSEGDKVIAGARTPSKAPSSLSSDSSKVLEYDQTWDQARLDKFAKEALSVYGKVDYLINNAGYAYVGAIEEST
jgi:NAD(P)-dependent dehydrogenase (short-subunit alcohol dehydrogenase family)